MEFRVPWPEVFKRETIAIMGEFPGGKLPDPRAIDPRKYCALKGAYIPEIRPEAAWVLGKAAVDTIHPEEHSSQDSGMMREDIRPVSVFAIPRNVVGLAKVEGGKLYAWDDEAGECIGSHESEGLIYGPGFCLLDDWEDEDSALYREAWSAAVVARMEHGVPGAPTTHGASPAGCVPREGLYWLVRKRPNLPRPDRGAHPTGDWGWFHTLVREDAEPVDLHPDGAKDAEQLWHAIKFALDATPGRAGYLLRQGERRAAVMRGGFA